MSADDQHLRVTLHCYSLTSQVCNATGSVSFGRKQIYCYIACDLEVTDESVCFGENVSAVYLLLFFCCLPPFSLKYEGAATRMSLKCTFSDNNNIFLQEYKFLTVL